MVVSIGTVVGGGGAEAAPVKPAVAATPQLDWETCGDLQCSTLEVPKDYAHPGNGTIKLAVTRKVHTKLPYRGIMLTNPGGPGGSGTYLPILSDYVPGS